MIQTGMINTDELPNDDTSLAYRIACMTIDELVIRKKPWEMDGAGYKETWAHLGFSEHPAHDVID